MTRERAKALLPFIKAYSEGKEIEYSFNSEDWESSKEMPEFVFDNPYMNIRFPEKQEYCPYETLDDLIEAWTKKTGRKAIRNTMPLIWVKGKNTGNIHCIEGFRDESSKKDFVLFIDGIAQSRISLFNNFTFLDGSPCGVKI